MEVPLESPEPQVNLLSGHITLGETKLTLHCHDSTFKKATILGEAGQPLFHIEGTTLGTSWSWRRKVLDGAGNHLFDLRHHSADLQKNGWVVESPDKHRICSLEHTRFRTLGHAAITASFTTATTGQDVLVDMVPMDSTPLTAAISVGGSPMAAITKIEDNQKAYRGGDKTEVYGRSTLPRALILAW